jgi:DNA-binding response OmpR family regulator
MPERPLRVFIVDDSAMQLELTARTLRLEGFEVTTASSSFGVTNKVRTFEPDIVLLDVEIPGLSGDRLLEVARKHAPPGTRFILYSACDESRLRELAREVEADGWISKSVSTQTLVGRLRRLFGEAS